MAKHGEKLLALKLRKKGLSIGKIASQLGVSKSSVSNWCENIQLTENQRSILLQNSIKGGMKGRLIGAATNRQRKIANINYYREKAKTEIGKLSDRDMLVAATALYWAEGAKTFTTSGFSFMNSDPKMILFVKNFLINVMEIKPQQITCTVQINKVHEPRINKVLKFWSSLLKLPPKQFRKPYYVNVRHSKKYENHDVYFGTLRLKVEKSSNLRYHILGLIESLMSG